MSSYDTRGHRVAWTVGQGQSLAPTATFDIPGVSDITGYTSTLYARRTPDDPVLVVDLSTTGGEITVDGPNLRISVNATPALTQTWPEGVYAFEWEYTNTTGQTYGIVYGSLKVCPSP